MTLADYEKLGAFYLGRDTQTGTPFLYDARHLTTHGVVIGMTGSGKTGLSVALLEEAAIDGIPAIVVDPKGDLGNLLLTFPGLTPEDFVRWAPAGSDGANEAKRWADGIAAWDQDGARIERLRASADVAIWTPGSRVGRPLSILGSLAAPRAEERADVDMTNERIAQVATSLLGLIGIEAEAGKSREHVLIAQLLQRAWTAGEDLDLAGIVRRIQDPVFERLGVLDLESFFPKKDRFELAIAFNALLASPGFEAWLEGPPLDVRDLLWTKDGKPRISVLSIAHLGDAERMFFVSLLLGQVLSWMRAQPGTPSLRAIFFMDEIVGYLPPVAMPPSKRPLLLLLKQARAFGLGIVLATQNPVDLDYKALSNAGTWLIGRLQTERDKARVLDGLEGVAGAGGFDRADVDRRLSSLAKRHFYVHDVHAPVPHVIESRWTLSYLRGPLTRDEIKSLAQGASSGETAPMAAAPPKPSGVDTIDRPVLPPGIPEAFFPTTQPQPVYRPSVVGAARVHFEDTRSGLDFAREVMFVAPLADGPIPLRWEDAKWAGPATLRDLGGDPAPGARFVAPPSPLLDTKSYAVWSKSLAAWLAGTQGVTRFKHGKTFSQPGESEQSFRARLAQVGREDRDGKAAAIREKYATKLATLEEKIRRKQDAVAREQESAADHRSQAAFSVGGGLLGAFLGGGTRRVVQSASASARSASRASRKEQSAAREKEALDVLLAKHAELRREAEAALAKMAVGGAPSTALEEVVTKPKKTGVLVHLVALAWRADA